jgi:protocatechuate 3,4-dioxygenase beta subunit
MSVTHFALLLLMCLPSLLQSPAAQSQTNSEKQRAATISGRVILNGEPLGSVTIQFLPKRGSVQTGLEEPLRAVADEQGRYRITGIPAGIYRVDILSDEFLIVGGLGYIKQHKISVLEGENVEQFDLVLKQVGAITGRVTNANGRPLTRQAIELTRIGDDGEPLSSPYDPAAPSLTVVVGSGYAFEQTSFSYSPTFMMTDEQGVYRVALLPEGRYLVSAGMTRLARMTMDTAPGVYYPKTYYPGVSDPSKARVVEVRRGMETAGVDILIAKAMKTHNIKGRVVNAETGNPVEGVTIGYTGGKSVRSNADGIFQFQGVFPGKYQIYSVTGGTNDYFSEPVLCEITDGDVDGVEVKLQLGGSIGGEVIIDGANDPIALAAQAKLSRISIECVSKDTQGVGLQRWTTRVKADGSFRIGSVRPGKIYLYLEQMPSSGVFWLNRVELGGQGERIISDGLQIGPGENVSNVRVIISYGRITLRGEVKIIGGDLPPHMRIYPYIYRLNNSKPESRNTKSAFVDARGQFAFSNLIPGEYEIRLGVALLQPSRPVDSAISKLILNTRQKVSIGGDGSGSGTGDATVTLSIDLSQKEGN